MNNRIELDSISRDEREDEDHDSVEDLDAEPYEPKNTPMKRLANVINCLESIIWDYLAVEFKDAYHAGKRKNNLDVALTVLVDERDAYLKTWSWAFYKIFATYEAYHRLDDVVRLVSYHSYLNRRFNQIKGIIKAIENEEVDWTHKGMDEIMLDKYECKKISSSLVTLLQSMLEVLEWKVENNICDMKDDKEHEYKIPKGATIKYHIHGMLGDYSGKSRFASVIKYKLLDDMHIVLKTLPAALEGYLIPKFMRVIGKKVNAADNIKQAVEPIKRDNQAKEAELKQKSELIEKQEERLQQYQADQERILQSISTMQATMFSQSNEMRQLKVDVQLLRSNAAPK